MQKSNRMKKEMDILQMPPPGISCWATHEDVLDNFQAEIIGGKGTPYEGGIFHLEIKIPERYPFEPPKVQFTTAIYHPNVDSAGRICLDLLKMPPTGSWKPCWNLSTLLTSIQLLMAEPNPNDSLMVDIAAEFKHKRSDFISKAKEWTQKHAVDHQRQYQQQSVTANTEGKQEMLDDLKNETNGTRNKLSLKSKTTKRPMQELNRSDQSTKKEKH
ncbi:ubiquitin-conjugating enzyme E2 T-like isoform X2 [Apostichopus japonicus]